MAPAIKELSRWLDANSEYYVAPDWADVVKHSVSMIRSHCVSKSFVLQNVEISRDLLIAMQP